MKKIEELVDVKTIDEILRLEKKIFSRIKSEDDYWNYDLDFDFLSQNKLIPVVHVGNSFFNGLEDEELSRVINVFKKSNIKEFYISNFQNYKNFEGQQKFYILPCDFDCFRELGRRSDDFKYQGDVMLISPDFSLIFVLEWDVDLIIGKESIVSEYLNRSITETINEFKLQFSIPIRENRGYLQKLFNYLKHLGKINDN